MSSRAPDGVIRPALVFVLLASAMKLLNIPNGTLGLILLCVALMGFSVWGAVDAAENHHSSRRGQQRWHTDYGDHRHHDDQYRSDRVHEGLSI